MLNPTPMAATTTWPIAGDVPELQQIVWAQADTISDQADLINAYQNVLSAAQATAAATGTGTAPGTINLTVSNVSGSIAIGSVVTGSGVTQGISIIGQQSGPVGGAGVYTLNVPITATNVAMTFWPNGPPSSQVGYPCQAAMSCAAANTNVVTFASLVGAIAIGAFVQPTAQTTLWPPGTTITGQTSGTSGGAGTYTTSSNMTSAFSAVQVTLVPAPPTTPPAWPPPAASDVADLNNIVSIQTGLIRLQTSLLQQYQQLLNASDTPAPATGP
jgi:hypothetical protein